MARLPTVWNVVGGPADNNNWGQLLNDFLLVAHKSDGTLANPLILTTAGSGAGLFGGADCTKVTNPVAGTSECLDTTRGVWNNYDGTGWQSDAALSLSIINAADPRFGMSTSNTAAQNDTALSAAVSALPTTGGIVYIPGSASSYNWCASTLAITKNNVTIRGAGRSNAGGGGTANAPTRLLAAAASGACLTVAGTVQVSAFTLEDLDIAGNATADYGVRFLTPAAGVQYCTYCRLRHVTIANFTKTGARGVSIEGGVGTLIENNYLVSNYDNLYIDGGAAQNVTTTHVRDTQIRSATRYGVYAINAPDLLLSGMGTIIESNGSNGIFADSNAVTYGLTLRDIWVGTNTGGGAAYQILIGGAAGSWRNVVIDGVEMADGAGAHDIHLASVVNGYVAHVIPAAAAGKNCVKIDAGSEEITILDIQDSAGCTVDPDNRAVFSFPNSASGTNGRGLRIGTGLTDPGRGGINISLADGYQVSGTALKNITETLSNKTIASPVLSGTVTGTYTLGGTPTLNATLALGASAKITGTTLPIVLSGAGHSVQLGDASADNGASLQFLGSLNARNFLIANQNNTSNALEFTPSTANGGSTFTTPAFSVFGTGGLTAGAPTGGDPGAGKFNIASADGFLVNNVALKNITETLSNKTVASPVFSGTATGTYTLSGTVTLGAAAANAPILVSVLQANLPAATNGTVLYCSDCNSASACTAGGTGAFASRQNGAWKCL